MGFTQLLECVGLYLPPNLGHFSHYFFKCSFSPRVLFPFRITVIQMMNLFLFPPQLPKPPFLLLSVISFFLLLYSLPVVQIRQSLLIVSKLTDSALCHLYSTADPSSKFSFSLLDLSVMLFTFGSFCYF